MRGFLAALVAEECVCECGVNSHEERAKKACGEFPQGPRFGQGKMSGAEHCK